MKPRAATIARYAAAVARIGAVDAEFMKKARVKLKDEIFHLLQAFRAGQKHQA